MPKTLGDQLVEEVCRRQQLKHRQTLKSRRQKIGLGLCLSVGLLLTGALSHQLGGDRLLEQFNVAPAAELDALPVPETGVLKQYRMASDPLQGRIRFFARAPVDSDDTKLSQSCGTRSEQDLIDRSGSPDSGIREFELEPNEEALPENQYHYFVQLLDWKSNEVVATVFLRHADMVEVLVPPGVYKVRYAAGDKWYGETHLFGLQTLSEMTDTLPRRAAKIEVDAENGGSDISFNCGGHGNLGTQPVDKDAHKKGIPLEPTDSVEGI